MLDVPNFSEGQVVGSGDVRQVAYGEDSQVWAEFRTEAVYQEFESEERKRPVYKDVIYLQLRFPGDKNRVYDKPAILDSNGVRPPDPVRFPRAWANFQAGVTNTHDGIPLKEWPLMTSSQIRELNGAGVFTVEQLAGIPDMHLDGLGHGGRKLRDAALHRLDSIKDEANQAQVAADKAAMQKQIDDLKATIAGMSPDPEKRGPGRPRKETEE